MTDSPDARLARISRARYGVFTRSLARQAGFSDRQIRHRIATGAWRAISHEAFMAAGTPETFEAMVLGGTLSIPEAVAGFEAAGRLLAIPGCEAAQPLILAPRGSTHRLPGIRVRETSALPSRDVHRRWGIAVTTRARTLCDLGRVLDDQALVDAFDHQLEHGLVELDGLYGVFYRYARRGRPGVTRVRAVLEGYEPGFVVPESTLERRTLALIDEAGLPRPACQVTLAFWDDLIGRVDFAYVDERIVIEVDGRRFHGPEVFESDRERDNAADLAGWHVLRFTWKMVTERPDYVIATITAALARARREAA